MVLQEGLGLISKKRVESVFCSVYELNVNVIWDKILSRHRQSAINRCRNVINISIFYHGFRIFRFLGTLQLSVCLSHPLSSWSTWTYKCFCLCFHTTASLSSRLSTDLSPSPWSTAVACVTPSLPTMWLERLSYMPVFSDCLTLAITTILVLLLSCYYSVIES